jgi:hypothetical protein
LLVATLALEFVLNGCEYGLRTAEHRVDVQMGQHGFANLPRGNPLDLDFLEVTEILGSTSRRLASEIMRLSAVRLALEQILDFTKATETELRAKSREANHSKQPTKYIDGFAMMEEKIGNMVQTFQQLKLTAECEEKRTETQIAIVSFEPEGTVPP